MTRRSFFLRALALVGVPLGLLKPPRVLTRAATDATEETPAPVTSYDKTKWQWVWRDGRNV